MSQDNDAQIRAAERAERAERMAKEGAQAMAEHLASIKAVDERTVRLRALRLAKEAADAEQAQHLGCALGDALFRVERQTSWDGRELTFVRLTYHRGYPVTVNHPEETSHAISVARDLSADVNTDVAPMMGGEDFSYMLEARPGAYIFVGNGDTAMVHHPAYNFDDDAIPFGSSWYAGMVEARMPAA